MNANETSSKLNIRKATPEDAAAISAVWQVVCAERTYTAVNRPFTPEQERTYLDTLSEREGIFLAQVGETIAGFQSLDQWIKFTDSFDHVGTVGTIVRPEWRGRGIGRRLSLNTLDFARAHGYEKLVIYVRENNAGAQSFYHSLGFVPKGVLAQQVKIDGQYEDEVFMELFL